MGDTFTLADLERWQPAGSGLHPPPRLSVFGDPVAHSLSPQMHNPALADCGIDAQYVRIHLTENEFAAALKRIHALGFFGTNITIPHKFVALKTVDVVDERARRLGAVNTIVFKEGRAHGFNSDGPGFLRTVREAFGVDVRELRILILGAGGGAGRAVAVQCALEQCRELTLLNRTADKVSTLLGELVEFYPMERLHALSWEAASLERALPQVDLIINGTNLGMKPEDPELVPAALLEQRHFVYDMVYKPFVTPLIAAAQRAGAQSVNGLPMLLHQGAVSFEWWFDRPAPLEAMRAGLWAAAGLPSP